MKIEKVDVIVTSPGRNFVTLKLTTSGGVIGLGDATLNGRETASWTRSAMPWMRLQRASLSPCMPKIRPWGPILTRIGPHDRGRKPPLTCGDAVEPPIGIEPMTYSLRVRTKPSVEVQEAQIKARRGPCDAVSSN